MALLVNPTTPALAEPSTRISQAAAGAQGSELHVLQARSEHDFDPTFAKLVELRARALIIAALAVTTAARSPALPYIPAVGDFVPGYANLPVLAYAIVV